MVVLDWNDPCVLRLMGTYHVRFIRVLDPGAGKGLCQYMGSWQTNRTYWYDCWTESHRYVCALAQGVAGTEPLYGLEVLS
jgi:hypothetical protein